MYLKESVHAGKPGRLTAFLVLLTGSSAAMAHNPLTGDLQERLAGALSTAVLLVFWLLYVRGAMRHPPPGRYGLGFHAVFVLCVVTVLGPLDDWAKTSTAAHMSQHMLMMVVIAPLWVLCRPLPQISAGGGRAAAPVWKLLLQLARRPLLAAYVHGAVIWFWHTPWFYMLAVENPWWHSFEHACFLVTGGVFWWSVLKSSSRNVPWALLALLFTLMHTGFLGALLSFAGQPLYGEARSLQDQQLAGLIMWVLGAVPYLLASAWLAYRWYLQIMRQTSSS